MDDTAALGSFFDVATMDSAARPVARAEGVRRGAPGRVPEVHARAGAATPQAAGAPQNAIGLWLERSHLRGEASPGRRPTEESAPTGLRPPRGSGGSRLRPQRVPGSAAAAREVGGWDCERARSRASSGVRRPIARVVRVPTISDHIVHKY